MIGSVCVVKERCAGTEEEEKPSSGVLSRPHRLCDYGEETRTQSDGTPRRCAAAVATELDVVVSRKEWGAPGRVPQRGGGGGEGGIESIKLGVKKKKKSS